MITVVVAAVVLVDGKILLGTRPEGKPPAGWEFPGGKVEKGEDLRQALRRELREELGVESVPCDPVYLLRRPGLRIWFLRTRLLGTPEPREGQRVAWFPLAGFPEGLLANDNEFRDFLNGK